MGEEKKRSIIKDRHIAELETWLSTQEAARRMGLSRQGAINLARDSRSPVRAVHVGKHSENERGYWIFDPYSVDQSPEAERKRQKETKNLIARAEGRTPDPNAGS